MHWIEDSTCAAIFGDYTMSLAAIKRKCKVGARLQMVHHGWFQSVPAKCVLPREIVAVQSNAIQFEGGSWLQWPPASYVRETPLGFEISLADPSMRPNWEEVMRYEWR